MEELNENQTGGPEQVAGAGEAGTGEPGAGEEGQPGLAPPSNPNMRWYIIHSYSGFERKVKESLESRRDAIVAGLQPIG